MWFVNPGRLHWKKIIFSCKWLSVEDSCWIREWEIVSTFPFPPQDPSDLNCACPVHVARGPVSHMCTSPVVNRRTPLYWFLCSLCLLHFFTSYSTEFPELWREGFDGDILLENECSKISHSLHVCSSLYLFLSVCCCCCCLCITGCPQTQKDLPSFVSQVLGLKVFVTTTD